MRRVPRWDLVLTAAILVGLPFVLPNPYWFDVAIRCGFAAIAVIGLNILIGFAGQLSIGHAALVAGAAYISGILTATYGLPSLLSAICAVAAVSATSFLLARPMLRLRGFALAIGTLGLGLVMQMVLTNEGNWTGGPDGMVVPPLGIGELTVSTDLRWYALTSVLLFLSVAASLNLFRSPGGRALRALNGAEVAAQVAGVDSASLKIAAFTVAGFFAGVSGALTAHYSGFITPSLSSFMQSVQFATMVVLGGRGSTYGVVLAAAGLTILPQILGGAGEVEAIAFGLILSLTMIFLPQGIVPTLARTGLAHRLKLHLARRAA